MVEEVSRSLTATLVGDAIMGAPFSIDDWVGNELGSFIGHSIGTSIKTQAREYYALKRGRDQLTEQDMHKVGDLSDEQSPHTTKSHDEVSNTLRGSGHDEKAMGAQAPAPYKDHDGSDYQKHITKASTNWLEAGGNTPDILKTPAQLCQEWMMQGMGDAAPDIQMHQLSVGQRLLDAGLGALWTLDAASSTFFSATTAATGVGIPLAAAFGMNAVFAGDHAQASFREAWSGQVVDTFGVKGLTALTGSHKLATEIDLGIMAVTALPGIIKLGAKRALLFVVYRTVFFKKTWRKQRFHATQYGS